MKFSVSSLMRWHPILSLTLSGTLLFLLIFLYEYFDVNYFNPKMHVPVSLIGVHHLGSEFRIPRFYVDKSINDSIGEGGGGGSMMCCLMLPKKWTPGLAADVRWEVLHIIKSGNPDVPETDEIVGIYQARVPIEQYAKSGDFFVHFFEGGRVRIVVSEISSDGDKHPIQSGDVNASATTTVGTEIKSLFTREELANFQHKFEFDRKKMGDWR